ncbi:hypothetical protein FPV67DRAFT_1168519 [Lyophyllum atratum]|nr:hypothetical protein FPV67DRAFT_1168519 [Lyophyllum atratum]
MLCVPIFSYFANMIFHGGDVLLYCAAPDTRFHCQAAAGLLVNLHLCYKLLLQVHKKQEAQSLRLNNLACSTYQPGRNSPYSACTVKTSAILILAKSEAPGASFKNMLHPGPIHDCVTAHHCRAVIADPGLLLSSESDSGAWNRDGAVAGAGQGGPGDSREEQKKTSFQRRTEKEAKVGLTQHETLWVESISEGLTIEYIISQ